MSFAAPTHDRRGGRHANTAQTAPGVPSLPFYDPALRFEDSSYTVHTIHCSVVYRLLNPTLSYTQQTSLLLRPPDSASLRVRSPQRPPLISGFVPQTASGASASAAPSALPSLQEIMWRDALRRRQTAATASANANRTESGSRRNESSVTDKHATRTASPSMLDDSNFIRTCHGAQFFRSALVRSSNNTTTTGPATFNASSVLSHPPPPQPPRPEVAARHLSSSRAAPAAAITTTSTAVATAADNAGVSGLLPLSTFDLRELSKVALRDALFVQLLDLLPARDHIQAAVWHLDPHHLQIDAAIAVPRSARSHPSSSVSFGQSTQSLLRGAQALADRATAVVHDAAFFAWVLRPYLGVEGSAGMVESVLVDTTGAYTSR